MIEINENVNSSLDSDFNLALELSTKELKYFELMGFIEGGNVAQKQMAALVLQRLNSKEDALKLVANLSGQDGKIREVVALKVNELIKYQSDFFLDKRIFDIFIEGIADVNANVCREVIESVCYLKDISAEFCSYFCDKLVAKIESTFLDIARFNFRTKKFVISKKMFNLYWSLEVLGEFTSQIEFSVLKSILLTSGEFADYTIREKTAKILSMNTFKDEQLEALAQKLKQDSNYYVRRY